MRPVLCLRPVKFRDNTFKIVGRVKRPSLFEHKRKIFYEPANSLVICDELKSTCDHLYVSSLHLAPDLLPILDGEGFEGRLPDGRRMRASVAEGDATIRTLRGQSDPPVGWSTVTYGKMEPTSVVQAIASGRHRTITWQITFT